jgi:hypothetical protein
VGCLEAIPLEVFLSAPCGPPSLARARLPFMLLTALRKNTEKEKQINILFIGIFSSRCH